MKKLVALLCVLSLVVNYGFAQTAQNDLQVSESEYKQLLKRFESGDTTLTAEEGAKLYYGFAETSAYKGNADYGVKQAKDLIQAKKYAEAFKAAKQVLKECPVSFSAYEVIMFVDYACRDTQEVPKSETVPYMRRFFKLMEGVFSTGNGQTKETAMPVICVQDEYIIMKTLGLTKVNEQELVDQKYDRMDIELRGKQCVMWFDVTRSMDYARESMMSEAR